MIYSGNRTVGATDPDYQDGRSAPKPPARLRPTSLGIAKLLAERRGGSGTDQVPSR